MMVPLCKSSEKGRFFVVKAGFWDLGFFEGLWPPLRLPSAFYPQLGIPVLNPNPEVVITSSPRNESQRLMV